MAQLCDRESHKWNMENQAFLEQAAGWHEQGNAPAGQFYASSHVIHYWMEDTCSSCGARRLLSAVFDHPDSPPIPDEAFLWLTIFITRINESTGYIEEEKKLIHYALDQMPWAYFPQVKMRKPDEDTFTISFKHGKYKEFSWAYRDAYLMFLSMNELAGEYLPRSQITEIDSPFTELEKLKAEYRTLMEMATQSGLSHEVEDDMGLLRHKLKELTYALNDFL